jgi:hypothetical protein
MLNPSKLMKIFKVTIGDLMKLVGWNKFGSALFDFDLTTIISVLLCFHNLARTDLAFKVPPALWKSAPAEFSKIRHFEKVVNAVNNFFYDGHQQGNLIAQTR